MSPSAEAGDADTISSGPDFGAFYYLRIVKIMYFDEPADRSPIEARGDARVLLSANGLALLLFGILPQPLMGLCAVALVQSQFY